MPAVAKGEIRVCKRNHYEIVINETTRMSSSSNFEPTTFSPVEPSTARPLPLLGLVREGANSSRVDVDAKTNST